MNILSLFDGMACGMIAMQKAGIEVDRYVSYEIDKYAVQTSSHNFPMIEHRGDVFKADFTEFEGFDFLVGGSPCTYWSIAQKNNRETEASGMGWELFSQYVRALHEAKPKFFVYENNKSMSKAIRASIDEAFGFEAIGINSALVSAQNRQRLYWAGKRNEDGTYSKVDIEQPADRGVSLSDVLENDVQPIILHNLYGGFKESKPRVFTEKSPTIRTGCGGGHIPSALLKGYRIPTSLEEGRKHSRKLTPAECMRLQTVPEWYEFPVSDSQAFKMLGNGWTCDIICWLLTACMEANEVSG